MNINLSSDILENKLQMCLADINTQIFNQDWAFAVDFDKGKVILFRERNIDGYTCRFAPKGIKVCYLTQCEIERQKEVKDSKRTKKVYFINKDLKIIDLNLQGTTNRVNEIKESFKGIEKLVEGERNEENYEASCLFAKRAMDAGFDGIYYSAHSDEKHRSEFKEKVIKTIKEISPHFEFDDAMGPKERLVVFKNKKEIISFEQDKYVTEVIN